MLTLSDPFKKNQFKRGGKLNLVMQVVDADSTAWFLSVSPLDIYYDPVTVSCVPLIQSMTGISEGFDPLTRSWKTGDVDITLSNAPFRREDAGSRMLRISDLLQNIVGRAVTLYLIPAGLESVPLADMLKRFVGYVDQDCTYDNMTCTVRITDKGSALVKSLPTTTVGDEYSNAPDVNASIPILYGSFTQTYDAYSRGAGNGLAQGPRFDRDVEPSFLFADHALKSIDMPWVEVAPGILAYPHRYVFVADARGIEFRKTQTLDFPGFVMLNASFYSNEDFPFTEGNFWCPTGSSYWCQYDIPTSGCTNPENVFDGNPATLATIYDNVQDSGALHPNYSRIGLYGWGVNHSDIIWSLVDSHHPQLTRIYLETQGHVQYLMPSGRYAFPFPYLCFGGKQETDGFKIFKLNWLPGEESYDSNTGWTTWMDKRAWDVEGKFDPYHQGDKTRGDRYPWSIAWWIGAQGTSGSTNDDELLSIGEQRLRLRFPEEEFPNVGWAEAEGRTFDGIWRTKEHPAPPGYDPIDLIEDPAYIIESLLRDELGLTSADIDTESFDETASTSITARLNVTKPASSDKLIKQISEQSTFCYVYSGAGKARLISMTHDKDVVAYIPWSHITERGIKISRTSRIVNNLIVNSRWIPEFKSHTDQETYRDIESETIHGVHKTTVKWDNINGSTADRIAQHYGQAPNYTWSRPHATIEFETLGFMYAHLELGDKIHLDSDTVDSHLLLYGDTWDARKFTVIGVVQKLDCTRIEAMELFPGWPGQMVANALFTAVNPTVICHQGNPSSITPASASALFTAHDPTVISGEGPKLITPEDTADISLRGIDPVVVNDAPVLVTPADTADILCTCGNPVLYVPTDFDYTLPTLAETVATWRFEENLSDFSGGVSHPLTGVNIEASDYEEGYTTPDIKTCLNLAYTGSGEYCYIPSADGDDFNFMLDSFTLEIIFKTSASLHTELLRKHKHTSGKIGTGWWLEINSGVVSFTIGCGPYWWKTVALSHLGLNDGEWHYVAVVVDRSLQAAMLYCDRDYLGYAAVGLWDIRDISMNNDSDLWVGRMSGHLDEVSITHRALSGEEIEERIKGMPIADNWALDFDVASDTHAKVLYDEGLNCNSGMSFMAWIKRDWVSYMTTGVIACKTEGNQTYADWNFMVIDSSPANKGYLVLETFNGSIYSQAYGDVVDDLLDGQWHHVVVTVDGTNWKFYVDGQTNGSWPKTALPSNNNDGDVYIGIEKISTGWRYNFPGIIDNLCVYSRALTPTEITRDYNSGNGTCSPPVWGLTGYWRFDEGDGDMIYDMMENNHARLGPPDHKPSFVTGKVKCNY